MVLAAVYLAFAGLARVKLAVVAVFAALVLTALLRPVVNQLARLLPRPPADVASMLAGLALVVGLFTSVGMAIAGQSTALAHSFQSGVSAFTAWLRTNRLHVRPETVNQAAEQGRRWLTAHRGELTGQVLGGAGTAAEFLTGALLALFYAVFFLASGAGRWARFLGQLPPRVARRWDSAGRAAWATFEGYSQATVVIAASNAGIVAVVLLMLRVPLAVLRVPGQLHPADRRFDLARGGGPGGLRRPRPVDRADRGDPDPGHRSDRGPHPATAHHGSRGTSAPRRRGPHRHVRQPARRPARRRARGTDRGGGLVSTPRGPPTTGREQLTESGINNAAGLSAITDVLAQGPDRSPGSDID